VVNDVAAAGAALLRNGHLPPSSGHQYNFLFFLDDRMQNYAEISNEVLAILVLRPD